MHIPSPTEFFKQASATAQHFGFSHIGALEANSNRKERVRCAQPTAAERRLDALGGTLTSGISTYFKQAHMSDRPALFFSTQTFPRTGEATFGLQVVGVRKSIAESLLIQTLRAIVSDLGYAHHSVRINSLGDQDSTTRYTRELTNFLKKRLEEMPPSSRECMKEHAITALLDLAEQNHELCAKSPSPLEYLSDASRRHFREIVEHLDMTETPYEIDTRLIGHHQCYADALFSIDLCDECYDPIADAPLVIRGGRLDAYTRQVLNVDVPAAGAVIVLRGKKAPARMPRIQHHKTPSVFMVQLGFGPKIRSLMLLSELRHAGIPVEQSFASDSLSEQLRQAETVGVPYALILGQKEYVEQSVIVRDMRSRSQECIAQSDLAPRLKRLMSAVA